MASSEVKSKDGLNKMVTSELAHFLNQRAAPLTPVRLGPAA